LRPPLLLSKRNILYDIPYKEKSSWPLPMNMNYTPLNYSVKGTPTTETKRSLLAFSRTEISYIPTDELIIEITRDTNTEYTELTKAFI
jgi:tRNA1Val (adenine37-N6)-methyltransferase